MDIFLNLHLFLKITLQKHYHDDSFLTFFFFFFYQRGKIHTKQVLTFGRNIFCCKISDTDKSKSTWTFKVAISKGMSLSCKISSLSENLKASFKRKMIMIGTCFTKIFALEGPLSLKFFDWLKENSEILIAAGVQVV